MCGALRCAAALYQYAWQPAGRGFPDNYAVGIECGGEQEHVRPTEIPSQKLPFPYCPGEYTFLLEAQLFGVLLHLRPVRTVAHEYHLKGKAFFLCLLQSVKRYAYALVPHHAAHVHKNPLVRANAVFPAYLHSLVRRYASLGKVHAVFHDDVISLVAYTPKVFTCSPADHPYLVAGLYVGAEIVQGGVLYKL